VVVGAGADKEVDVFGDAANIAARVEAAAEPGAVVVSGETHRLILGLFVVEERGAHTLKGVGRPVQLYRVIRPSGMRGRLAAAAAAGGLTPFVGREDELRSLMTRWERVLEGEGQVALIMGEAGIGKSRLLQRFHEQIAGTPHTWIESGGGAFFQNTPFYPVAEMLRQFVADSVDQIPQLASRLTAVGLAPAEAIPLLAPLLNLLLPLEYPPSSLLPDHQRRRLLATLVEWVLGSARTQPLVSVIEDLHWVDPSSLELIQLLVEQGAGARLLLLYTARPEFHPPWPQRAHHAQLALNRLSESNVRTMVGEVAAKKALSDETVATVVERTGGVPLFVEELTRAVLESGDSGLTGRAIPATLHDSLMARLDRLGPAKEVIQIGAVIGGEFSYQLLHAVHPVAETDLQRALRNLADADLLYVRGIAPEATSQFKHALIRDAAYEALLKSRRKDLHRLVAHTIDDQFSAFAVAHAEVLARHWTEAGETQRAIAQWSKAGAAAQARNAFREALESFRQALTLLQLLPESPERDLRELDLRESVVSMLQVTRGYSAPETIEANERVAALGEKSGNLARLVTWANSRWVATHISGDLTAAIVLADHLLDLSQREGSPTSLASAHTAQLQTRCSLGDLAGVEKHFTTGVAFFDDPAFKQFPGAAVASFGYASLNAWMIGRFDVARERIARMMAAVDGNNHYDVALAGVFAANVRLHIREYAQADPLAARALELSEQHQFAFVAAHARGILGAARAQLGHASEGIALIRQGIGGFLEIGARGAISVYTGLLAAAQEPDGAIAEALATVEQALQANPRELGSLRLRGTLRLKQGQAELAEEGFREAIAIAREMGAKAWELRATTSLADLLAKQDRRDEARTILAEIYGWFTEGFDTADLKDAKALLDELSG
jgi:tetratricopeptide (TPR) repeat protein